MGDQVAFPKPVKVKKPRKPLQRSRMRPSKRGTKHGRRPREAGFMAFCHDRGCELCLDTHLHEVLGIVCLREGPLEFAHLSDLKRYDVGDIGACLHQAIHRGIDGKEGGKAPWYVALEKSGQHLFRMRLANRARAAWDRLLPSQQIGWDMKAAAQRSAARP